MISVIICTRNRGPRLQHTLDSLAAMTVPRELSWEIVVVDNNSTDSTRHVVEQFAATAGLDVRYVFEARFGLSFARNSGIAASRGTMIAFTDDDCIVDTQWLAAAAAELLSNTPVSMITGRVELYDRNDMRTGVRTHPRRTPIESLDELMKFTIGCNMAFSRRVFDEVGGFDTRLGAGTKAAAGEDTDFLYRTYKKGFTIVYSPNVLLYHNHGRRTDADVQATRRGNALGRGAFYGKHIRNGDVEVLAVAVREIGTATMNRLKGLLLHRSRRKRRTSLLNLIVGAVHQLRS